MADHYLRADCTLFGRSINIFPEWFSPKWPALQYMYVVHEWLHPRYKKDAFMTFSLRPEVARRTWKFSLFTACLLMCPRPQGSYAYLTDAQCKKIGRSLNNRPSRLHAVFCLWGFSAIHIMVVKKGMTGNWASLYCRYLKICLPLQMRSEMSKNIFWFVQKLAPEARQDTSSTCLYNWSLCSFLK